MSCLLCPSDDPAHPDTLVCGHCYFSMWRLLDPTHIGDRTHPEDDPPSIPRLYALLDPAKKPGGDLGGRGAPGFNPAVPVDCHHVALRDHRSGIGARAWLDGNGRTWHREPDNPPRSTEAVLTGWTEQLIEAYGMRPLVGRPGVERLAGTLHTHLARAAAHDWIVEMAAELRTLSDQLRTATQAETGEYRPKPVASCRAILDYDEAGEPIECGGPLFPPRMGDRISCGICGGYLTGDQWFPVPEAVAS